MNPRELPTARKYVQNLYIVASCHQKVFRYIYILYMQLFVCSILHTKSNTMFTLIFSTHCDKGCGCRVLKQGQQCFHWQLYFAATLQPLVDMHQKLHHLSTDVWSSIKAKRHPEAETNPPVCQILYFNFIKHPPKDIIVFYHQSIFSFTVKFAWW